MFRTSLAVVAIAFFLLFTMGAAPQSNAKHPALHGKIVSVDVAAGKVVVQPKDPKAAQVTVATDANTKIKVNRTKAAIGDLKEGMKVLVMPPTGTATQICAHTPRPKSSK